MTAAQQRALQQHCRLAFETAHPKFGRVSEDGRVSIILTVNSGYE